MRAALRRFASALAVALLAGLAEASDRSDKPPLPCSSSTPPGAVCRWIPTFVMDVRADDDPETPRLAAVVVDETPTKERLVGIGTDLVFWTGPPGWSCGAPARRFRGLLTWEDCDRRERAPEGTTMDRPADRPADPDRTPEHPTFADRCRRIEDGTATLEEALAYLEDPFVSLGTRAKQAVAIIARDVRAVKRYAVVIHERLHGEEPVTIEGRSEPFPPVAGTVSEYAPTDADAVDREARASLDQLESERER